MSAPAVARGSGDSSHWGVSGTWAPRWNSIDKQTEKTMDWSGEIEGSELTIGIVRGSTRGGEWGVSFVQKPFEDGSTSVRVDESCENGFCSSIDQTFVFSSTFQNPFTGEVITNTGTTSFSDAADEFIYPYIALFKVEAQAGIIVAPAFKIKIAGGVNNPGAGVRVGFTVLVGAR